MAPARFAKTLPAKSRLAKRTVEECLKIILRAEQLCKSRGDAFTLIRRRVLETLSSARTAQSAYDLVHQLSERKPIAPIQIYRTLEFLQSIGVIYRIGSLNAYAACDQDHRQSENTIFLICDECGSVEITNFAQAGRFIYKIAKTRDFSSIYSTIEIKGRCSHCNDLSINSL